MAPGTIVSGHNLLPTVPFEERYLSACYMPMTGVQPSDIVFRFLVKGAVLAEVPGQGTIPTCARLQFPHPLATGDEVRVQVLWQGRLLAEDVYAHQDYGSAVINTAAGAVRASAKDWLGFIAILLVVGVFAYAAWSERRSYVLRQRRLLLG